jgi:hypothetical protein
VRKRMILRGGEIVMRVKREGERREHEMTVKTARRVRRW